MQNLETCLGLLIAKAERVLCHIMLLTIFLHWIWSTAAVKIFCYPWLAFWLRNVPLDKK